MSENIVKSGDIISLYHHDHGYLIIPSPNEYLSELHEGITHFSCENSLHKDFDTSFCELWNSSLFQIQLALESDKVISHNNTNTNANMNKIEVNTNEITIRFGSIVYLRHYPSQYFVCGSKVKDKRFFQNSRNDENFDRRCLFLEKTPLDELSSKWLVLSRFKIRQNGEHIRSNDLVVFRNLKYASKAILPITIPAQKDDSENDYPNDTYFFLYSSVSNVAKEDQGLRIRVVQDYIAHSQTSSKSLLNVYFGDFFRIKALEYASNRLICRVDDGLDLDSKVAPLGLVCNKLIENTAHHYGVYIRQDKYCENDELSSIDIWQVLPVTNSDHLMNFVMKNATVCFKHVLSGKFLSCVSNPLTNGLHLTVTSNYSDSCNFIIRCVDDHMFCSHEQLQFNDNIYLQHQATSGIISFAFSSEHKSQKWWEYENDSKVDLIHLDNSSKPTINILSSGTCKFEIIDKDLIQDLVFIKRSQNIALTALQALKGNTIKVHPTLTRFSTMLDTLSIWLEKGSSTDSHEAFQLGKRIRLIEDSRLGDLLFHFNHSICLIVKALRHKQDINGKSYGEGIPFKQLSKCCTQSQIILHHLTFNRSLFSARMLSIFGNMSSIIEQIILGEWNPPIVNILNSIRLLPSNRSSLILEINNVISSINVKYIIHQMTSLKTVRDEHAFQIMNILKILAKPGELSNRKFQQLIISSLLPDDEKEIFHSCHHEFNCPTNPLIQTYVSMIVEEEPQKQTTSWCFSVNQEETTKNAPTKNGLSLETVFTSKTDRKELLNHELDFLWNFFRSKTSSLLNDESFSNLNGTSIEQINSTKPTIEENLEVSLIVELLCLLGFGIQSLQDELAFININGTSFWSIWKWWFSRRLLLLPSDVSIPTEVYTREYLGIQSGSDYDFGLPSAELLYSCGFLDEDSLSFNTKDEVQGLNKIEIKLLETRVSWIDFFTYHASVSLAMDRFDRKWVDESLKLIICLCFDRFANAQAFASCVLPAELLLVLLSHPKLTIVYRTLLLEYLNVVYLNHDFVFSLQLSLYPNGNRSSSNDDHDFTDNISSHLDVRATTSKELFGCVFNEYSRYTYLGHINDRLLRQQLRVIISKLFQRLTLLRHNHTDSYYDYVNQFLNTILQLTKIDFFNDLLSNESSSDTAAIKSSGLECQFLPCTGDVEDLVFAVGNLPYMNQKHIMKQLLKTLVLFFESIEQNCWLSDMNIDVSDSDSIESDNDIENNYLDIEDRDTRKLTLNSEIEDQIIHDSSHEIYDKILQLESIRKVLYYIVSIITTILQNKYSEIFESISIELLDYFAKVMDDKKVVVSKSRFAKACSSKTLASQKTMQILTKCLVNCFLVNKDDDLHHAVVSLLRQLSMWRYNHVDNVIKYLGQCRLVHYKTIKEAIPTLVVYQRLLRKLCKVGVVQAQDFMYSGVSKEFRSGSMMLVFDFLINCLQISDLSWFEDVNGVKFKKSQTLATAYKSIHSVSKTPSPIKSTSSDDSPFAFTELSPISSISKTVASTPVSPVSRSSLRIRGDNYMQSLKAPRSPIRKRHSKLNFIQLEEKEVDESLLVFILSFNEKTFSPHLTREIVQDIITIVKFTSIGMQSLMEYLNEGYIIDNLKLFHLFSSLFENICELIIAVIPTIPRSNSDIVESLMSAFKKLCIFYIQNLHYLNRENLDLEYQLSLVKLFEVLELFSNRVEVTEDIEEAMLSIIKRILRRYSHFKELVSASSSSSVFIKLAMFIQVNRAMWSFCSIMYAKSNKNDSVTKSIHTIRQLLDCYDVEVSNMLDLLHDEVTTLESESHLPLRYTLSQLYASLCKFQQVKYLKLKEELVLEEYLLYLEKEFSIERCKQVLCLQNENCGVSRFQMINYFELKIAIGKIGYLLHDFHDLNFDGYISTELFKWNESLQRIKALDAMQCGVYRKFFIIGCFQPLLFRLMCCSSFDISRIVDLYDDWVCSLSGSSDKKQSDDFNKIGIASNSFRKMARSFRSKQSMSKIEGISNADWLFRSYYLFLKVDMGVETSQISLTSKKELLSIMIEMLQLMLKWESQLNFFLSDLVIVDDGLQNIIGFAVAIFTTSFLLDQMISDPLAKYDLGVETIMKLKRGVAELKHSTFMQITFMSCISMDLSSDDILSLYPSNYIFIRTVHTKFDVFLKSSLFPKNTGTDHIFCSYLQLKLSHQPNFITQMDLFNHLEHLVESSIRYHDIVMLDGINISKKAKASSYEIWTQGGLKLLKNLTSYLSRQTVSCDNDNNFLFFQLFMYLLKHRVNDIRNQHSLSLRSRKHFIHHDIQRLHKVQNILDKCNIAELIIGGLFNFQGLDELVDVDSHAQTTIALSPMVSSRTQETFNIANIGFVPTRDSLIGDNLRCCALKLGSMLMAWNNRTTQDSIMKAINNKISIDILNSYSLSSNGEFNHLFNGRRGLKEIFQRLKRRCCSFTDFSRSNNENILKTLDNIKVLLQLCSALCESFYDRGVEFLCGRAFDDSSKPISDELNILNEILDMIECLALIATRLFHYLKSEPFRNILAPHIWKKKNEMRRKFISWHHPRNNFELLTRVIGVLSVGFDVIIKVNDQYMSESISRIMKQCPKLIYFISLLNLDFKSDKSLSIFSRHVVAWSGGDPILFYQTYLNELKKIHLLHEEKDADVIQSLFLSPNRMKSSLLLTTSDSEKMQEDNDSTKTLGGHVLNDNLGINMEDFRNSCFNCEIKILRFVTSVIANSSNIKRTTSWISSLFDNGILMQNMSTYYDLSVHNRESIAHIKFNEITVLYVSILSDISKFDDETYRLYNDWRSSLKSIAAHKSLVSSIEIVGPDGLLHRVYFPNPSFIRSYWGYPEVLKAKDFVLRNVNRRSPEEKVDDFFNRMEGLSLVMHRQASLRKLLSPLLHQLVGGKNILGSRRTYYFPTQQVIFVLLSFFLNIYFIYVNSVYGRSKIVIPNSDSIDTSNSLATFDHGLSDYTIYVLQLLHLCLAGLLCIRHIINSRAGDDLFIRNSSHNSSKMSSFVLSKVKSFSNYLIIFTKIALDSWWYILMAGISYIGWTISVWFYAISFLEVLLLFENLIFIVIAIRRNIIRIIAVVSLLLLSLYIAAILQFNFVQNQYTMEGHGGCDTMLECILLQYNYGISAAPDWENDMNGAIIRSLGSSTYGIAGSIAITTAYHITYVIFIIVVLPALIAGLIVDSLLLLRSENEKILKDMRSTCFICSISRDEFEKNGISFREHVREEHNMWKYLWFKIYLETQDSLSYTRHEHYASELITSKNGLAKLLPIKKSLSLQQSRQAIKTIDKQSIKQ